MTMNVELSGDGSQFSNRAHDKQVTSVWGIAGVGKSTLVRSNYFEYMITFADRATNCSWVDVPETFDLTHLSRCLLIDFYSDDLEAKETVAAGMMEGQDPIQGCRKFLQEGNYFVVIDGLRSIHDWDLINEALLSRPIRGRIIVITDKESVAMHCVAASQDVINVKGLEPDAALELFTKVLSSLPSLLLLKCFILIYMYGIGRNTYTHFNIESSTWFNKCYVLPCNDFHILYFVLFMTN